MPLAVPAPRRAPETGNDPSLPSVERSAAAAAGQGGSGMPGRRPSKETSRRPRPPPRARVQRRARRVREHHAIRAGRNPFALCAHRRPARAHRGPTSERCDDQIMIGARERRCADRRSALACGGTRLHHGVEDILVKSGADRLMRFLKALLAVREERTAAKQRPTTEEASWNESLGRHGCGTPGAHVVRHRVGVGGPGRGGCGCDVGTRP